MIVRYLASLALAVIIIVIAVILGDYGPWYFSWLLGTGFMILVSVSGAVLLDSQDEERERERRERSAPGETPSALHAPKERPERSGAGDAPPA